MNKTTKIGLLMIMLLISAFLLAVPAEQAEACHIGLTVEEGARDLYDEGDELVLKAAVFLTHRNCPEGIEATQFRVSGMEILGATDWAELSSGRYERLIKVKVTKPEKDEEAILEVRRVCTKEGGYASISFKVKA